MPVFKVQIDMQCQIAKEFTADTKEDAEQMAYDWAEFETPFHIYNINCEAEPLEEKP